jgi:predicted HicB family RNase H-like nuclease
LSVRDNTLRYKNYRAAIRFSKEDKVFHGKIDEINDLVTFEGTSLQQVKKAFRESVEDYLITIRQLNPHCS